MIKEMLWAIYSQIETDFNKEPMFWSDDLGWVDLGDASLFVQYPAGYMPIPDGRPVAVSHIGNEISVAF